MQNEIYLENLCKYICSWRFVEQNHLDTSASLEDAQKSGSGESLIKSNKIFISPAGYRYNNCFVWQLTNLMNGVKYTYEYAVDMF